LRETLFKLHHYRLNATTQTFANSTLMFVFLFPSPTFGNRSQHVISCAYCGGGNPRAAVFFAL